jgi:hypothetical protein
MVGCLAVCFKLGHMKAPVLHDASKAAMLTDNMKSSDSELQMNSLDTDISSLFSSFPFSLCVRRSKRTHLNPISPSHPQWTPPQMKPTFAPCAIVWWNTWTTTPFSLIIELWTSWLLQVQHVSCATGLLGASRMAVHSSTGRLSIRTAA